ncbi:MAG TPA: EVE domain-containing protein [Bacteroidales bacterium]|nr:EVE domain-containing protein [Bacteroidales bacterium]
MKYWLLKSEPETYSWDSFVKEGISVWDGVRNFQARNYLREMKVADQVLFYHSGKQKQVMGTCTVTKEHYPEPGQDSNQWVVVEVTPVKPLPKPVSLKSMKEEPRLGNLALFRHTRLSVVPLTFEEYKSIFELGNSCKL